ncbi:uncharacterized protein EDB91DRAFT_209560 [Suillus paluster]|uniref:uncharacterized protein n=1 Tax=Suillus paluster TaxID=48578 RepID=UPI001B85CF18|nr:uncharacterized protein EDB91DRAFT_209560 [Suillus paluster]KAG1744061.1 hypothetical protein EDB91DRAFT_209560 [Suillus paluster]
MSVSTIKALGGGISSTNTIVYIHQVHCSLTSIFQYYFTVAASVGVIYDCALTFGQEVELFWRQRWSLMTIMYLSLRCLGISYIVYVWKAKPWRRANQSSPTISLNILSMSPHTHPLFLLTSGIQ